MNEGNGWWRQTLQTCTPEQLDQIIGVGSDGEYVFPNDSYNRVFDGIYIGDEQISKNISLLKSLNIRHVLNSAFGKDLSLNLIDISSKFYTENDITFLSIPAIDIETFNLYQYFEESAEYIHQSLAKGGNVLVHCKQGISRSATLVLSYLMIKRGLSAPEAVRTVRQHREIRPNNGFLRQLCYLNDKLIIKTNSFEPKN